jgi:hypothetical protein
MKKHYSVYAFLALTLVITLPAIARADDGNISVDTETSVNAGQGSIRDRIRADYQAKLENVKNNQDSRNIMMAARLSSSTLRTAVRSEIEVDNDATGTPTLRPGMPRGPRSLAPTTMMGSTTLRGDFRRENGGNSRAMRLGMFEARKHMVTHELDVAIHNLGNIRERLDSRIQKEQAAGRNMSAGISALATADAKIKIASDAVAALETYAPEASTTITTSSTVSLDTARSMVEAAKDAIKVAQRSLNDVVVAIAHALGVNLGASASSTVSQ